MFAQHCLSPLPQLPIFSEIGEAPEAKVSRAKNADRDGLGFAGGFSLIVNIFAVSGAKHLDFVRVKKLEDYSPVPCYPKR